MITKIATTLTVVTILSGGVWQGYEIKQEVGLNTTERLIQTFERLSIIRKTRRLSHIEWRKWCEAGIRLQVFVVCPPR